jgi:hypothetical protein
MGQDLGTWEDVPISTRRSILDNIINVYKCIKRSVFFTQEVIETSLGVKIIQKEDVPGVDYFPSER